MTVQQQIDELRAQVQAIQQQLNACCPPVQKLLHPVEAYRNAITQKYGVYNEVYTLTKRHIGIDYATPSGTLVHAPWNGEITTAGYTNTLGHFCHYQYLYGGKKYTNRFLHLLETPTIGSYSREGVIGKTGNSGFSTNFHVHVEVWLGDVDLSAINERNWDSLTVSPEIHFS